MHDMKATYKSKARVANSSIAPKANYPTLRSKANGSNASSNQIKQDRLTLIAFYALFAAVLTGMLYFLSLLLFI